MLRKLLVLTVALLAGLAKAQDMESSPLALLVMPEVKKELKLSAEQSKKLGAINKNYQNQMRDMARSAARDPDAADKMERLERETAMDSLAVLTPDQSKRLTQIQYQVLGGTSLYIPAVQKQLALTDEQMAKLKELQGPPSEAAKKLAERDF